MHKILHSKISKIMFGLVLLGFLVFLVGATNLPAAHAQGITFPTPSGEKVMPGAFYKYSPTDGSTIAAGTSVMLAWTPSTPHDVYFYCYDTSNNNQCDSTWYWNDNSNFTINNGKNMLDTGVTYYWQAMACTTQDPRPSGCIQANAGQWFSFSIAPASFMSNGAQDGYILETSKGSGVGSSTLNYTATTLRLGDDASNRQYRAILSFDTSAIPDTAVIQSAVLKIYKYGSTVGTNPFNWGTNYLYADIRKSYFGSSSVLQPADFNSTPSAGKVASFGKNPVSGWYSAPLNAIGLKYINKAGLTQFRLFFSMANNNNSVADYINFLSGNNGTNKPQLIIKYNMP